MHVAAILRLVPDTREELEVDASGRDIDREWVGMRLSEFDDQALEEAVLLKERSGAKVTAIALAGEGVDRLLQTAVARGVDEVVRVVHDIADSRDTARQVEALAGALHRIGADVVLTGVMTPEDILGQLAGTLAGRLGWPVFNAVTSVAAEGDGLRLRQEYSGGRAAIFDVSGPVVIGVQSASQAPRYVAGSKLRQAAGTPIGQEEIPTRAPAAAAAITGLSLVEAGGQAVSLEGDATTIAGKIIAILSEKGLIGA
ncbi:Electron transfer flavoprotein subunit beta [Pseudogemmobacter humi]|uniref:Electron transfer flavoprotein subunit beta n=2 Tax=Pseudogemmobacter humi TaxID=2483812 RepID=A0A3P5WGI4_9RHOB|nr:electron transfer flavoprotein subunit beta/FixA family protein [Pseudogemmobacter humi]VDC22683.1 Electron transfer flavoprotein subunit beta [Pseudogemmobacter humi]